MTLCEKVNASQLQKKKKFLVGACFVFRITTLLYNTFQSQLLAELKSFVNNTHTLIAVATRPRTAAAKERIHRTGKSGEPAFWRV